MTSIESRKARQKRWYERNRESVLAKRRKYYQAHKAQLQEYGRIYDRLRRKKQGSNKKLDSIKADKQTDNNNSNKKLAAARNRVIQEISDY